ncbi:beta-ketoacyl-ACP synthase 3 [Streptomyces sp. NPDC048057]|uniref:3-oxoacyl-ACP synthase III family protein n=1 Tax=Streptomyces sp. NPDC048057 TaxID=3155628 RepID=UPI0033E461BC
MNEHVLLPDSAVAERTLTAGGLAVPTGIVGIGAYLPPRTVSNEEIIQDLDTTDAWIRERIGIENRRFLDDRLATSDMCVAAARSALADAGVAARDVDVVIVATFTQDQPLPSTALTVAQQLGAGHAWALDLNQAACAGGVYGLVVASHLLQNPEVSTALVIGAETLSRVTDPTDRTTRVIFGDAAGAVVMRKVERGAGLLSFNAGGALSHSVSVPAGGSRHPADAATVAGRAHYLKMDGKVVWEQATSELPLSIRSTVHRAGLGLDEVDHYVLHQANVNIVHAVADELGVPRDRMTTTIGELGNTGAATVFTVLDRLRRGADLRAGQTVVISAIGAGFLWGSLCTRIPSHREGAPSDH